MKTNPKDYRPNVGMMIINQKKEIFVGKRIDHPSEFWQMPQGGIDAKEIPSIAALREMEEEVGIKENKVEMLTESQDWYYYSIPKDLAETLWKGKYKGQRQKWFLYKFKEEGREKETDRQTDVEYNRVQDKQLVCHAVTRRLSIRNAASHDSTH